MHGLKRRAACPISYRAVWSPLQVGCLRTTTRWHIILSAWQALTCEGLLCIELLFSAAAIVQVFQCMSMSRVETCGDTVGKLLGLPRQVRSDNRPVRLIFYTRNEMLEAM